MTVDQAITTISALAPAERLRIAQIIWDGLPLNTGLNLNSEQQAELDRRWAEHLLNPASALSEHEFRTQISNARN